MMAQEAKPVTAAIREPEAAASLRREGSTRLEEKAVIREIPLQDTATLETELSALQRRQLRWPRRWTAAASRCTERRKPSMTTMSFKTFTFPHNPERITVTTETRIATAHCPEYGPIHQNLGLARRIIRAEGVFYGANAKTQYTALEALMWQATAGNLRIPGMGVVVAFPTALSYTGEGDGTVLRYTAEFTELIASTDREGTRYAD